MTDDAAMVLLFGTLGVLYLLTLAFRISTGLGAGFLIFLWMLAISVIAAKWDLQVGWVAAGSVAVLVLLGALVMFVLWLYERWTGGR